MFHSVKPLDVLKASAVVCKDRQGLLSWQLRDHHLKFHDSSLHSTDLWPLSYLHGNTKTVLAKRHFTGDLGMEMVS